MAECSGSVSGCSAIAIARGWCTKHYQRWQHHGNPEAPSRKDLWDGKCKLCGSDGPFYARHRICKKCKDVRGKHWRKTHPEEAKALSRKHANATYRRRRAEAIRQYGSKCKCCGETNPIFLVVDHVNGGGNEHRRQLNGGGSPAYYRWLAKNNWPKDDFQLLCHNCNFAKSHGGCPHGNC